MQIPGAMVGQPLGNVRKTKTTCTLIVKQVVGFVEVLNCMHLVFHHFVLIVVHDCSYQAVPSGGPARIVAN